MNLDFTTIGIEEGGPFLPKINKDTDPNEHIGVKKMSRFFFICDIFPIDMHKKIVKTCKKAIPILKNGEQKWQKE